jgi:hypothetical protein
MGGAAIISSPQRKTPDAFDAAAAETRFAHIAGGKQIPYSDVDNALILRALQRQADVVRLTPVMLPNGTVLETEVRFGAHAGSSSTGMIQVDLATENTLTVVRLLAKGQKAASPLKVKAARHHQPVDARTPQHGLHTKHGQLYPNLRTRFFRLGAVAGLCCLCQLFARVGSPLYCHWMTIEYEINATKVETRYDLWNAYVEADNEKETEALETDDKKCAGDAFCEALVASSNTARDTTVLGLIVLIVVAVPALVLARQSPRPHHGKLFLALCLALALGGLVALAGAGNYRTEMTEAVEDHDVFDGDECTAGCLLSLLGGVVALAVGLLALALHFLIPPRKLHLKSVRPT